MTPTKPSEPKDGKPISVTFSVRLSDGSYDASLSVPVGAPEPQWRPVVEAWLLLMQEALKAQSRPYRRSDHDIRRPDHG